MTGLLPPSFLSSEATREPVASSLSEVSWRFGFELRRELMRAHADNTTTNLKVGDAVGVKWLADSCLDCEVCREGQ